MAVSLAAVDVIAAILMPFKESPASVLELVFGLIYRPAKVWSVASIPNVGVSIMPRGEATVPAGAYVWVKVSEALTAATDKVVEVDAPRPVTVANVSASVAVRVMFPPSETEAPPVRIPEVLIVILEFVSEELPILVIVFEAPEMVLLVRV